jgi:dihydroorotase
MVEYARRYGLPVTCETTPHHSALTDDDMAHNDSNYKMKPPLRACCDRDAVTEGIVTGANRRHCHRPCAALR